MKKLLLLLFLIPNLVMGESFVLVCEGNWTLKMKGSDNIFRESGKFGVKGFDDSIKVDGIIFVNDRYKTKEVDVVKTYEKFADTIYALRSIKTERKSYSREEYARVDIDRITGDIDFLASTKQNDNDTPEENFDTWKTFTGSCKKSEKAF
jgi:hypothetical protein